MPGRNDLTDGAVFMNRNLWKFWLPTERSTKLTEMEHTGATGSSLSPNVGAFKYNGSMSDVKSRYYVELMKYAEMQESTHAWEAKVYETRYGSPQEEGPKGDSYKGSDCSSLSSKQNSCCGDGEKWNKMDYAHKVKDEMEKFDRRNVNFEDLKLEPPGKIERPDVNRSLSYSVDRTESGLHAAYREHRSHSSYIPKYKVCEVYVEVTQ